MPRPKRQERAYLKPDRHAVTVKNLFAAFAAKRRDAIARLTGVA
jgi:hypothetical protein